ncbi:MAG TPA: DUF3795 domain-containing protein [Spirochaetota bacterium]|nr:DUF3795 domain-containing protein [Spirochaetota bacterium]
MDYKDIVSELAPCGIDCSRCVFSAHGSIRKNAGELLESLSGFEKMAKFFAAENPALAGYDSFMAVLEFLRSGECQGCRTGAGCYDGCEARNCAKTGKVDFCFECDSFPCDRNKFNPQLAEKWKTNNLAMKKSGVESFYTEQKKKPRY